MDEPCSITHHEVEQLVAEEPYPHIPPATPEQLDTKVTIKKISRFLLKISTILLAECQRSSEWLCERYRQKLPREWKGT